jgi:uncharacterized protein (TIGR00251 family)
MARAELRVRLQPRARRNEISGERDGVALVQATAPPVDGRANAALVKLIAKRAGVAKGRVSIARGERSRDKLVRVDGLDEAELRRALRL